MAIIALLLSILTPSLQRAKGIAVDMTCRSQFHQLGLAFSTLSSAEHASRLPGLWGPPWTGSQPWQLSWMGKEAFTNPGYQPAAPCAAVGTIVNLVGDEESARKLYRCPGLKLGVFRSGVGSNGMLDITMIQSLPGARTTSLPLRATVVLKSVSATPEVPLPVVVEEDPVQNINNQNVDMGHTAYNRMGSWHVGGSGNYLAVDGSAMHLNFNGGVGPEAWDWVAQAPNGTMRNLGNALPYGGWNQ